MTRRALPAKRCCLALGVDSEVSRSSRVSDEEEASPGNCPALLSEEELAGAEIRSERDERI